MKRKSEEEERGDGSAEDEERINEKRVIWSAHIFACNKRTLLQLFCSNGIVAVATF